MISTIIRRLPALLLMGILPTCSADRESTSETQNSCLRSCAINGGANGVPRSTPPAPAPRRPTAPAGLPAITDGRVVDTISGLVQQKGTYTRRGGCVPAVKVTITEVNDKLWAFIDDQVLARRPLDDDRRYDRCFYRIEDRYPQPLPVVRNRDRYDYDCMEFRAHRHRREVLVIRDRASCYVDDEYMENVLVGTYQYQGEDDVRRPAMEYVPDDSDGKVLEISGWDYIDFSAFGTDSPDLLGDYNTRVAGAFVNLEEFNVRGKFNSYMSYRRWHYQPTLIGYTDRTPETYTDGTGRTRTAPYIYVTNMRISHRDYIEGWTNFD